MAAIVLAGCTVGPDYRPPAQPMPAQWEAPPTTQASVTVQEPLQVEQWWTTFHDPVLDSLVRRAVASNLDLEAASERVRQARATVGVARAGLFPAANANGSYSRSGSGRGSDQDSWQAGVDAAWEMDIFGGIRRSVEAARAGYQASIEDRRDVLRTVLSEVATDYILLRGYQQEIIIAHENLDVQTRNLGATREKKTLGTGTDLDIAQAEVQVASTTASIESQEANEQLTLYALGILLGLPPTSLEAELAEPKNIPEPPAIVPVGLPAELLRRRPDIRRAERQLAAATAAIGVATADLYPRFTLSGNLNLQGNNLSALETGTTVRGHLAPASPGGSLTRARFDRTSKCRARCRRRH